MNTDSKPLALSSDHAGVCHERWIKHRNNLKPGQSTGDMTEDQEEQWANEQCGGCRFYVLLVGPLGSDWGACSNPASDFDGRVMFEHDGCSAFVGADAWVSDYFPSPIAEPSSA